MYERFQPSPSRKSETDIQAIDSAKASITVDTAMIASPQRSVGRRPARSTSAPMTSTSAYMPTMCRLMTVKTSACAWWWPTTMYPVRFITPAMTAKLAIAAITADGTPGRRRISRSGAAGAGSGAPLARSSACSSNAIVRGSGRMLRAMISPTSAMADATNQGMTSVFSSKSFPAKSGRKTSGPSAAPKSAPNST